MDARGDGRSMMRADLCGRLDRLEGDLRRLPAHAIIARLQAIRGEARGHGLAALERIAERCCRAVAEKGRGAPLRTYLDAMRDAAACERIDAAAGDAYLAAIAVRYAG